MTTRTYYRWSLFIPYIFPLIAVILEPLKGYFPEWLGSFFFFAFFSAFVWILPYTLVVAGFWVWSRDKTGMATRQAVNFLPIFLSLIIWIPFALTGSNVTFPGFISLWGSLAIACLATGYTFVILAHIVYYILTRTGIMESND